VTPAQESAPQPHADGEARRLIETALDETLVVEAAAGTGKTTELVRRIMRVLATGRASVSNLVAVTFTEKAAGELKLRLRQQLEVARHDLVLDLASRRRLEQALKNLEDAHISTIHGFCADLLRERPVEAAIDPVFTVLTEGQARRLYDEAFSAWFQQALDEMPEGVRRSLRRSSRPGIGGEADEDGPVERLRTAGWSLADWRDFTASWARPVFDRTAAIAALVEQVYAFAAMTEAPATTRDALYVDTGTARRASDELRLLAGGDDDSAEAILVDLCRDRDFRRARKGYGTAYNKAHSRAEIQSAHQSLLQQLDAFKAEADADLAALLRDELRGSIGQYEQLKARHGALDFLDLLLRARNLVRDRDDVRADFQRRFTCLFVDEFQDTDPLQAEILLLLAADDPSQRDWTHVRPQPGKLFIVGDPKQSIYRFRRADVGIYRRVCEQLSQHGARCLELTTSFRSVPDIQRAVNAAFAPLMTGDAETLQARYVPLAQHRPAIDGQPAVVALPVPEPYGKRNISAAAIERSLPDAVGAFVAWLVNGSGWRVRDYRQGGELVDVEPRHICILFRRFVNYGTDVTRAYVDALEARGIKHLLVGGRAFHDREEIETVRAALAAVEWPDDELSVFATLRGGLFAIGDEELLEYRHRPEVRAFHPFRVPEDLPDRLQPIAEALRLLAELHARRNRRPVAETIARLFEATRAHVGFALRRAGEQVLANALHVAELARQYELSGGISFRGFVEELRTAAEDGQAAEAPIVEEGSDGVRLMTVHKAKGLEFPVVILADITAKIAPVEASRHLDAARGLCALRIGGWSPRELLLQQPIEQAREREEGIRIAYVAATRARDLLVVPAVGDQVYESGWVAPLGEAIYPSLAARRTAAPAPQCPPFRKDSVLTRPDAAIALAHTVSPGLHRVGDDASGYAVVWWDPAALALGVEPPFGLRRQELIARDVAPEVVADGQRRYIAWRERRGAAIAAGARPSVTVLTTTEWARQGDEWAALGQVDPRVDLGRIPLEPEGEGRTGPVLPRAGGSAGRVPRSGPGDGDEAVAADVTVVALDDKPARPGGARYGTLVHASLASVALDADEVDVEAVVATQGRIVGAPEVEVRAAIDAVGAVLRHPLFDAARRAQEAGACFRETAVTLLQGEILIEGVIDFAFEQDGAMTVIDFKTDRADGALLRRYQRQVALYADAISRATGKPAQAVLMKV
jgi:ATP-dependent exoDNAse (exonuclease V) beta subunit